MIDQLTGQKPNETHVRQEIHNYVKTIMTGFELRPQTQEKTGLKKSK
jgi:hypothetical protein